MAGVHSQSDSQANQNDLKIMHAKITAIEHSLQQAQLTEEKLLKVEKSLSYLQYSLQKKSDDWTLKLEEHQTKLQSEIDSLLQLLNAKSAQLEGTTDNLDSRMVNTEESTQENFTQLASTLSQRKMVMLIFIVIILILIAIIFMVLRKQIKNQNVKSEELIELYKTQLEKQIADLNQLSDSKFLELQKKIDMQIKKEINALHQKISEAREQFQLDLKTAQSSMVEMLKEDMSKTTEMMQANHKQLEKNIAEAKNEFRANIDKLVSGIDDLNKLQIKLEKRLVDKKD
jgi:hypothetical protein